MKYWVYINGEVPGSFEPSELARIRDFSDASMVCPADGGIAERNWQRAGLFGDIVRALEEHRSDRPALPPPEAADYLDELRSFPIEPDKVLGATSQRLFSHVTELMKELEHTRDERALTQSLEKSLAETKNELLASRDRIRFLEDKVSLIPGYEDREERLQDFLNRAKTDIKDRDKIIADLNKVVEDVRKQLADNRQKTEETASENKNLERWVNDLNQRLADKELALAKSLAVIQRLDKQLSLMVPQPKRPLEPRERPTDVSEPLVPAPVKPKPPKPPQEDLKPLASSDDPPRMEASSEIDPPEPIKQPAWVKWAARIKDQFFPD